MPTHLTKCSRQLCPRDIIASLLNTRSALLNGIEAMAQCGGLECKVQGAKATPSNSKGKKARKMHDRCEQLSVQLDDRVFDFLQERRNFGLAVSNVALIDEAKRVAAELNIVGFKASNRWLVRGKQCFNVGLWRKMNESQALLDRYQDDLLGFSSCVRHMTGG